MNNSQHQTLLPNCSNRWVRQMGAFPLWLECVHCTWTGKQLQMNRMGMPQEEEGGGAETRVNVLSELPLLEARLDAPSLRVTDAELPQVGSSVTMHTIPQTLCSSLLRACGSTA